MRGVTLVLSSHLNPFDHIVVFQGVELNIFAMKDRERENSEDVSNSCSDPRASDTLYVGIFARVANDLVRSSAICSARTCLLRHGDMGVCINCDTHEYPKMELSI
jgi:hypothetical protein